LILSTISVFPTKQFEDKKTMTNRDLLKEAIADAKVVKETAIANAKLALEETFNPFLKERLAAVLAEMDEVEEGEEELKEEMHDDSMEEDMKMDDTEEKMEEDMDLEELLRELEEMDSLNEAEDLLNDPKGPTAKGNVAEEEAAKGVDDDADGVPDAMDDDINIEDMSTEDLESFIKDVISDMVSSGELEGGEEEGKEDDEEMEMSDEEEGKEDEEEIDIEKMVAEIKKSKAKKEDKDEENKKMKKELKEAYDALKHIKSELNEVNLFNAKLLYTNKIFRNKNLSESQKVKVLAAFDKAVSVKEAKLVYETLSEGLKTTKAPVNESLLRGAASKVSGIAPKKPILEVNDQVNRWQLLAGIKKQL
jgi:hypothetical protein